MAKPSLTLAQQVELLKARGFTVDDDAKLARFLYDNSYYRLSGYWRYFQTAPHLGDNTFNTGVTLARIRDVYRFDSVLRNVLMEGLCDLEIAVRGRLAYHMSEIEDGAANYLHADTYVPLTYKDGTEMRVALLEDIQGEIHRSKEHSVSKYRDAGDIVPVWVAMEAVSFGTVSKMYRLFNHPGAKEKIAKRFELGDSQRLDSTLHALSVLRNVCAHHGRIWNKVVTVKPFVLKKLMTDGDHGVYYGTPWSWIVVLADLVDGVRGDATYSTDLMAHVAQYPEFTDGLKYPHSR